MNIYGDNPAEEFSLMENDEKFSQRIKQIENIVNSAIKEIKENNEWTKLSSKWYDKQTSKDARLIIYEIQNHPNIVTICRGIASKNVLLGDKDWGQTTTQITGGWDFAVIDKKTRTFKSKRYNVPQAERTILLK